MKVFKFGGASLRDAASVLNMVRIVRQHAGQPLLIVVSAMGKTTNALERLIQEFMNHQPVHTRIEELRHYHLHIATELIGHNSAALKKIDALFNELTASLRQGPFDEVYDQVVCYGELLSSVIVQAFMESAGLPALWLDARDYILTDNCYREGKVQWEETEHRIRRLHAVLSEKIVVTQGFIGRAPNRLTTTLGREGSDYTAAIFGACLEVESVTIWKDVPGVMSADPKRIPDAVVFPELPYKEAAEMTYYGASVIHPKTIAAGIKRHPAVGKKFCRSVLAGHAYS